MDDGEKLEAWRKATEEQLRELERMRRTVSQALRILRRRMRDSKGNTEQQGCMADILRLSQIQIKLIPLEQDLHRELEGQTDQLAVSAGQALSEEEWQVLEQAIQQRKLTEET